MTVRELQTRSRRIRQVAVDVWCERRYLASEQHRTEHERASESIAEIREALRDAHLIEVAR